MTMPNVPADVRESDATWCHQMAVKTESCFILGPDDRLAVHAARFRRLDHLVRGAAKVQEALRAIAPLWNEDESYAAIADKEWNDLRCALDAMLAEPGA